jgi:hypothetical protein
LPASCSSSSFPFQKPSNQRLKTDLHHTRRRQSPRSRATGILYSLLAVILSEAGVYRAHPRVIGIIMLQRKSQIILELQQIAGKILRSKKFDNSVLKKSGWYCAPVAMIGEQGCGWQGQM